jgi:hypothetical protein
MPRVSPRFAAMVGTLAFACGSDPLEPSGSAGAAGNAPECQPAGFDTLADSQYVGTVEGVVQDLDGNAPADLLVQVCGLDLCINAATDDAGFAAVTIGSDMKLPAFKYGDGLRYGKIALLLAQPTDVVDVGIVQTPALPSIGSSIAAGATSTSAGVTLEVASGASVSFDRLTYRTEDEQAFRAAELPATAAPPELDPELGLELYFALGPIDTEFCPAATLSVPNSLGWAAGTPVEFYVHGLDVGEAHAPYGGFALVGDGLVDDSGTEIRTAEQSLPVLSLVGIRRKP